MTKDQGTVACPCCGSLNEISMREPRAVCTFCGEVITLGEKSGL